MNDCENCKHRAVDIISAPCDECLFEYRRQPQKGYQNWEPDVITNIDRIRAMDIDHLIEWYCHQRPCGTCRYNGVECGFRDWLEKEVKE